MIEVTGLSKRYGDKLAVDQLSFRVQPGRVTGFLGPNGAGNPVTELRRSSLGARRRVVNHAHVSGRTATVRASRGWRESLLGSASAPAPVGV